MKMLKKLIQVWKDADSVKKGGVLRDVIANFIGKGLSVFLAFLFAPFLIKILGIEAYGLVGFFMTLQAILLLLDFGFSVTLNRRLSLETEKVIAPDTILLVRYLERLFFLLALVVVFAVVAATPWLGSEWITHISLSTKEVAFSIGFMGIAIAMQLPYLLYAAGLNGVHLQVKSNAILAIVSISRYGGAFVLLSVFPHVEAFFAWLALSGFLQTIWARSVFFRALRVRSAPNVEERRPKVRQHVGFAAGVGATAVLGTVLTQLDKLALSKMLSLGEYGYYSLAWTLSAMLFVMAIPIATAFFPRLSASVASQSTDSSEIYHDGSQLMAISVVPAAVMLLVFSAPILNLWLRDAAATNRVEGLLVLLTLGTLLNTMAYMPHAIQLAYGIARFGLYANAFMVALAVPSLYFAIPHLGATGAAWVWVGLNALYVVVGVPLMHQWILKGEVSDWFMGDVLKPFLSSLTVAWLCSLVLSFGEAFWKDLGLLIFVYAITFLACLFSVPRAKQYLLAWRG